MLSFKQYMRKLDENANHQFDVTTQKGLDEIIAKYMSRAFAPKQPSLKMIDGVVHVYADQYGEGVVVDDNFVNEQGFLKVNFAPMDCSFSPQTRKLKSLAGFPERVKNFILPAAHPGLPVDLVNYPKHVEDDVFMTVIDGDSLVGISQAFKFIGGRNKSYFSLRDIRHGGIELINIEGLTAIGDYEQLVHGSSWRNSPSFKPFEIIEKYLGHPEKLFDCQAELIDNGFEDYAEL